MFKALNVVHRHMTGVSTPDRTDERDTLTQTTVIKKLTQHT